MRDGISSLVVFFFFFFSAVKIEKIIGNCLIVLIFLLKTLIVSTHNRQF